MHAADTPKPKPVRWVAQGRKDLLAFPREVRRAAGYALYFAQRQFMKTKKLNVTESSGNIFRDLRLPDADNLLFKAELVRQLCNRIEALRLTQVEAAKRLGLKQPDVSKLVNGRHTSFSADRLIALLNALQIDVEITLRPRHHNRGQRGAVRVRQAR